MVVDNFQFFLDNGVVAICEKVQISQGNEKMFQRNLPRHANSLDLGVPGRIKQSERRVALHGGASTWLPSLFFVECMECWPKTSRRNSVITSSYFLFSRCCRGQTGDVVLVLLLLLIPKQ